MIFAPFWKCKILKKESPKKVQKTDRILIHYKIYLVLSSYYSNILKQNRYFSDTSWSALWISFREPKNAGPKRMLFAPIHD
jgi:hypothetical protein